MDKVGVHPIGYWGSESSLGRRNRSKGTLDWVGLSPLFALGAGGLSTFNWGSKQTLNASIWLIREWVSWSDVSFMSKITQHLVFREMLKDASIYCHIGYVLSKITWNLQWSLMDDLQDIHILLLQECNLAQCQWLTSENFLNIYRYWFSGSLAMSSVTVIYNDNRYIVHQVVRMKNIQ